MEAYACVMGSMDLVRPLGLAGIKSVVVSSPGSPAFYSRFVSRKLSWEDPWQGTDAYNEHRIADLVRFGAAQPEPPVLFYEGDLELVLVSRHREQLSRVFRFVIAESTLVDDLVDKARFQAFAERMNLPVPATQLIDLSSSYSCQTGLHFPLIIKPTQRRSSWVGGPYKALMVETPERLREIWPTLQESSTELLAQEVIPGPESRIESYHVYIDRGGDIVAEFSGRKIRTLPATFGHSTALETTDAADIITLGRAIVQKLGLHGVAKLDFKRAPDSKLYLLEINPRFNLWHHLGAIAGVNIPALVYADLMGLPRLLGSRARAGVCWCKLSDLSAARASGMSVQTWLMWMLRCEAKSSLAWDDPMPILRGAITKVLHRRGVDMSPPPDPM